MDQTPAARQMLEAAECPVVQIMETGPDPVDMMVGFSHRDAARAAVEHLVAAGYARIGFLGARMDPRTQRRLQGYRDAIEGTGAVDEGLIVTTLQASSVTLGGHLFGELVGRRPNVEAVFCNNDDIALGTLFEAQRRNIAVPAQLGICGFNDLEMMAATVPPLSSVVTHRGRMGEDCVAMLIEAIEGRRPARPVVDLGFQVVARESTQR